MNLLPMLITIQAVYVIPIIVVAVLVDLTMGDPPNAVHPVAWLGRLIGWTERQGLRLPDRGQFVYGIFMTVLITGIYAVGLYYLFLWLTGLFNNIGGLYIFVYPILGGIFLKSTFTIGGLRHAAIQVRNLLQMGELEKTRRELRALVSRDTSDLSRSQVVSSAVESVAEGLCDSVVAPLFYFLLLGLPGALAYRAINTFDSMIGYHGKYEYLGKFAARLDDIVNWIPARMAALLLLTAASFKGTGGNTSRVIGRFRKATASPNAGWPMAAMAGALDVKLQKPGHYTLGDGKGKLVPETIDRALTIFTTAAFLWVGICIIGGVIYLVIAA